jgi:hypothetical protein
METTTSDYLTGQDPSTLCLKNLGLIGSIGLARDIRLVYLKFT